MSETAFGSGIPFEYTISEQDQRRLLWKRASLIAAYAVWAIALLLVGIAITAPPALVILIPLTLWPIISLSWRITQVEYEYSYFDGTLTVSRVLGGKSRKVLTEVAIKAFTAVYPCEEEYIARAEQYRADKIIFAASSQDAPNLCVALWQDERETKYALYFEPNEKAIRLLRTGNYAATTALRKPSAPKV